MRIRLLLIITAMVMLALINGCATSGLTYLPPDVEISVDPKIDDVAKRYIDYWIGFSPTISTGRGMDITFVVEKIDIKNKVVAIYSWGSDPQNWVRIKGKFTPDNGILIKWGSEADKKIIIAKLAKDGTLALEFRRRGNIQQTTLTRYLPKK